MQGLEILNVDVKCVKGHWVKIPAESVHLGEAWSLEVLHLRRSGTLK